MGSAESPADEVRERVRASIGSDDVLAQTDRICRSDAFDGLTNAQKVLRFLVARTIERRPTTAREIALEALGKEYFDRYDSQPRQEVATIRKKLEEFYKKEAKDDDIWLEIPPKQFDVFWRHSPKTLLGRTEFSGWVASSAMLPAEDARKAAKTAQKFWPELASVFPVYCAMEFDATLEVGKLMLPDPVKMFFDSIGSYHVFITSFDRSEIRIYPLRVWLEEWANAKRSEKDAGNVRLLEFWGHSAEIGNRAEVSIHTKLLDALNLPKRKVFRTKVSFDSEGFVFFDVPKPLPRPRGKYWLHEMSYVPNEATKFYYYILVAADKEKEFKKAMAGTTPFNLKDFGYILESGEGDPPEGLKEQLRATYAPVLGTRSRPRLATRR